MTTDYSIDLANPAIFNNALYPYDEHAFDNYNVIGSAVLDKSYDELVELVGNKVEANAQPTQPVQPATPAAPRKVTY